MKTYQIGDCFFTSDITGRKCIFMIVVGTHGRDNPNPRKMARVSLTLVSADKDFRDRGTILSHHPVEVDNVLSITEKEFNTLCGPGMTLIPVKMTIRKA